MMTHTAFISYSSQDTAAAEIVCLEMENRGIPCWMAPRDVLPGIQYAASIVNAIKSSQVLILILTPNSNQSPHVLGEVERAFSNHIPIIPFKIQDVQLTEAMEYFISTSHWLEATHGSLEENIKTLAHTVWTHIDRQISSDRLVLGQREKTGPVDYPSDDGSPLDGPDSSLHGGVDEIPGSGLTDLIYEKSLFDEPDVPPEKKHPSETRQPGRGKFIGLALILIALILTAITLYFHQYPNIEDGTTKAKAIKKQITPPGQGSLIVEVQPKDAKVELMDYDRDYAPGLKLEPGLYRIRVSHAGYKPVQEQIKIGPDEKKTVAITLLLEERPPEKKITRHDPVWVMGIVENPASVLDKGQTLLVYYSTAWCHECRRMEEETFKDVEVNDRLTSGFHMLRINGDEASAQNLTARHEIKSYPSLIFIGADGRIIARTTGFLPPERFLPILEYLQTGAYLEIAYPEFLKKNNRLGQADDLVLMKKDSGQAPKKEPTARKDPAPKPDRIDVKPQTDRPQGQELLTSLIQWITEKIPYQKTMPLPRITYINQDMISDTCKQPGAIGPNSDSCCYMAKPHTIFLSNDFRVDDHGRVGELVYLLTLALQAAQGKDHQKEDSFSLYSEAFDTMMLYVTDTDIQNKIKGMPLPGKATAKPTADSGPRE